LQEKKPTAIEISAPQNPTKITIPVTTAFGRPSSPTREPLSPVLEAEQAPSPTPAPLADAKEADRVEPLGEAQLHALFSGAPHFSVSGNNGRPTPTISQPWDGQEATTDVLDSRPFDQSAFTATTLRTHATTSRPPSSEHRKYRGYEADVVEVPSMRSAQGLEPGSIGFSHYLELPKADSLTTDIEASQSGKEFLQGKRNKELMQTTPERLGIRAVDMDLIYDRLIEIQDLYEALHNSPGPMTILNHQNAGDLYANLFSKFLTPPGYDGATDDPTGLRVQIVTLMRILKLRGVWYDFSLVEWRIRLGQILWSDPDAVPEHESHPLWTEREVLLLQITLACELLLRLDAVTNADVEHADAQLHISKAEIRGFFGTKTRKLDWDLVLARRFLDNILVVKNNNLDTPMATPRGFLSMLGVGAEPPEASKPDVVLLPQHQARQLSGLIKFATTIRWPSTDILVQELSQKLGARDVASQVEQVPSPDGMFPEVITSASISVYGTPLQTPRPGSHVLDGYFGHVGKPVLSRDNSRSLRIPLSPTLSPVADQPSTNLTAVGGWLSRSFLTGLVLPGEAISHFLISTLLENDKTAIASLGDSANLYGGFSYTNRTWWSKNSVVGRVFACADGAVESMGWISFPRLPEGYRDCWHSIHSEQLPYLDRLSDTTRSLAVAHDSAVVPSDSVATLRSEDLVLPRDTEATLAPVCKLEYWELTPLNPDLIDNDMMSGPPTESDIHVPSITFTALDQTAPHTLTLAFDVQFVTSWPCTPPMSTPAPSMPQILKRSHTVTISRKSSTRSGSVRLSRRNSHGFEPLLSHPPDSKDIAPKPMYSADAGHDSDVTITKRHPMNVHPLHISYKYKIVPVTEVLVPDFNVPFDEHTHKPTTRSPSPAGASEHQSEETVNDKITILVLDARASSDLQLLARGWCAEKGFHAVIGRAGRTCLACCIREARGLGINVVIRV
jgi:hypothetical protein